MTQATFARDLAALMEPVYSAGPISIAMMVTSVDGRATVSGRVGQLTGSADQKLLLGAREHAAAVIVGGRTVRAEGYEELLPTEAQARREVKGLPAEPELVVFTRASPSLPQLWQELRERHPQQLIVCEGGPTVLGMAVEHRLVDQIVMCVSPQIVGDDLQKRLLDHPGMLEAQLELIAATTVEGFLFLRYGLS